MADIKYSTNFMRNYILNQGICNANVSGDPNGFQTGQLPTVRIYQGALPVKSDLNAATSPGGLRTGDILIHFSGVGTFPIHATDPTMVQTGGPWVTAATATGTAAWFMLSSAEVSQSKSEYITGTVSLVGGGGDLEIGSISIVNGNQYVLNPMSFTFPLTYTY